MLKASENQVSVELSNSPQSQKQSKGHQGNLREQALEVVTLDKEIPQQMQSPFQVRYSLNYPSFSELSEAST